MKLEEYLNHLGIRHSYFSKKIGASPQRMHAWLKGKCRPPLEFILLIERETRGNVAIQDWLCDKEDKANKAENKSGKDA
jgi:DNA-binding transcriptional regulator YdaS (Cro superfamily)